MEIFCAAAGRAQRFRIARLLQTGIRKNPGDALSCQMWARWLGFFSVFVWKGRFQIAKALP